MILLKGIGMSNLGNSRLTEKDIVNLKVPPLTKRVYKNDVSRIWEGAGYGIKENAVCAQDLTFKKGIAIWQGPIAYLIFIPFLQTKAVPFPILWPEILQWLTWQNHQAT